MVINSHKEIFGSVQSGHQWSQARFLLVTIAIHQCSNFFLIKKAPFVPALASAGDTSNFDEYDEEDIKKSDKLKFAKEFADF